MVLLRGMMGVTYLGNRWNRSCRREANCGLQQHAHGLPESPRGAHGGCPNASIPGVGFLNASANILLRPEASPDPSPRGPRRRIRRRNLEGANCQL